MILIFAWLFFFISTIAVGQDVSALPDCQQINEVFMTKPWFAKITAAVLSGMGAMRVIAEVILRLAPASKYGEIAIKVAGLIGLFGIGTPKGKKDEHKSDS